MTFTLPRFPRILLASGLALGALGASPALCEPPATVNAAPVKGESMDKDHKDMLAVQPAACAATAVGPERLASDPEEGGQVARTAKTKTRPKISEMTITKKSDTASAKLIEQSAPAGSCSSPR